MVIAGIPELNTRMSVSTSPLVVPSPSLPPRQPFPPLTSRFWLAAASDVILFQVVVVVVGEVP